MELGLLQSFIAVAEHGNFGLAAQFLSTTQPALSKRIQLLERQTGTTLFVRGRQGAVLTTAGRALLADSVDLVRRAETLEHRMRRVGAGKEGVLHIGFGMSTIDFAPRAVAAFRAAHSTIDIVLNDMSSSAQFDAIRLGDLSIGFVRLPVPTGLAHRWVREDQLAIALPPNDAIPDLDRESLRTWLTGRQLIRLKAVRGPGLSAQIDAMFADLGARVPILQEASDLLTVLALTAAGVGAAIVPLSAAAIAPHEVRLLPVDLDSARWGVGAALLRESVDPLIALVLKSTALSGPT